MEGRGIVWAVFFLVDERDKHPSSKHRYLIFLRTDNEGAKNGC